MNHQLGRTLQDMRTTLAPGAVLGAARTFFGPHSGVYSAFVEKEGPTHLVFRGQGGEEIVIAANLDGASTRVSGSSYLFDQQVARFLSSLPEAAAEGTA
jgi:hypothetical protein